MLWQSCNKDYFNYDSLRHYLKARQLFDVLQGKGNAIPQALVELITRHPPGVYFLTALFYFVVEPTQENTVVVTTALFVFILIWSLFQIGKIFADERTGILAVLLIISYPVVFTQARTYMLDLPLLAWVSFFIYCLIRSDFFQKKSWSLISVLAAIIGVLIKPNFLIFVAGPFIFACWKALRRRRWGAIVLFCTLIAGIFVTMGFLAASSMYIRMVIMRFFRLLCSGGVIITNTPQELRQAPFIIHKIRGVLWYMWGFINWQAGFLYCFPFLYGLYHLIRRKSIYGRLVLVWFFSSYLILSWSFYAIDVDMEVTGVRYSMPLLASVALISAYGLLSIGSSIWRRIWIGGFILFGIIQHLLMSYPVLPSPIEWKIPLRQDSRHILPAYINVFSIKPIIISGSNWTSLCRDNSAIYEEVREVFFLINAYYQGGKIYIAVLSDDPYWRHLKYLAWEYNRDLIFLNDYSRLRETIKDFEPTPTPIPEQIIARADFVIETGPRNSFTELYLLCFQRVVAASFADNMNKFEIIRKTGESTLYRRNETELSCTGRVDD